MRSRRRRSQDSFSSSTGRLASRCFHSGNHITQPARSRARLPLLCNRCPPYPLPLHDQSVTEDTLTNRTPEAHAWAVNQFRSMIAGGQFVPPSLDKLTIDIPGFAGGAEWGGPAVDPKTGVLYVNANDTAWVVGLTVPPPPGSTGESVYRDQCSVCHGIDRAGSPPAVPTLRGIDGVLTDQQIANAIRQGKGSNARVYKAWPINRSKLSSGTSPGFRSNNSNLSPALRRSTTCLIRALVFVVFLDPDGYPATAPPWGTLSAIDMNTGKYLWKIPFGEYPELTGKGVIDTGSDNYGGPIVTAGGLLFIGASVFDAKFHAYDSRNGKLLWQTDLPFSGLATPVTYMVNGKQYVVIAAGGGQSNKKPSGGIYVAFALP